MAKVQHVTNAQCMAKVRRDRCGEGAARDEDTARGGSA